MAKKVRRRASNRTEYSERGEALTWEQATAKFIPWAVSIMIGYATYNIEKLTSSVTDLNVKLTTVITTDKEQSERLDRQGVFMLQIDKQNNIQDQEIAALKAHNENRK